MTRPEHRAARQLRLIDALSDRATPPGAAGDSSDEAEPEPSRRSRARRPRGTGAVFHKGDRWYGQWYVRGRLVKRSLGPVRPVGTRDGLTRTQAESHLREMMQETDSAPEPVTERLTIAQVGERRIKHLERTGRKPDTTLATYESEIRIHFVPFFGDKPVDQITVEDVEAFIDFCLDGEERRERDLSPLSVKPVRNLYVHLNGLFEFAQNKAWAHQNPCRRVDKPASADDADQEIRFLDQAELDALVTATKTPSCRHTPATLARAEQVRTLRDIEAREWKESVSRSAAHPPPRSTCIGHRLTTRSKMISPVSITPCISPPR